MNETALPSSQSGRRPLAIGVKLALFCCDLYAVLVIIYLILRLLLGESLNVIALANALMPSFLMPALIIFPLLLIWRKWWHAALMSPALIAFLMLYGELFLPNFSPTAAESTPTIAVMTYNLESQIEPIDEPLAIIRASGADLVALQEVTETAARRFARNLAAEYPYQFSFTDGDQPLTGTAILSRYPLENPIRLPGMLTHMRVNVRPPQDTCLSEFVFYSVHPPPGGWAVQAATPDQPVREVGDLLAWSAGEAPPVIMAGDFNMTDQSTNYRFMRERFDDAYRASGWGLGITWPHSYGGLPMSLVPPIIRIDYIFYEPSYFRAVEARAIPNSGGSDHFPVVAGLTCLG